MLSEGRAAVGGTSRDRRCFGSPGSDFVILYQRERWELRATNLLKWVQWHLLQSYLSDVVIGY